MKIKVGQWYYSGESKRIHIVWNHAMINSSQSLKILELGFGKKPITISPGDKVIDEFGMVIVEGSIASNKKIKNSAQMQQFTKTISEQVDQIVIRPEDRDATGKLLVRPNGPISNLTEYQWKVARTPAFKQWFGEGKVVDENGEPLVVYRGNMQKGATDFWDPRSFNGTQGMTYESSQLTGIYFSKKKNNAKFYVDISETEGEVLPVFLRIEKPYIGLETEGIRKDSPLLREYDGAINETSNELVAFNPGQILILTEPTSVHRSSDSLSTASNSQKTQQLKLI